MSVAVRPAHKELSSSIVGLSAASILLAAPVIPARFVAFLVSWTRLSWVSACCMAVIANELVAVALICTIVIVWEHQTLRSVGLHAPSIIDALSGITTFVLSIWLLAMFDPPRLSAHLSNSSGTESALTAVLSLPLWFRICGTLVNGISEETIFRGFAIERLATITNSTWIGTGIAYAASIAIHIPAWGIVGALSKAPALSLFVCLYLWRRNLPACILAHVLVDGFSLVFWPILPAAIRIDFWRLA